MSSETRRLFRKQQKNNLIKATVKSRGAWFVRISSLFQSNHLDNMFWENLEELLICADVGIPLTQRLLKNLKTHVHQKNISGSENSLSILKTHITSILESVISKNRLETEKSPLVILMVGANGVGKTTNSAKLAWLYQREGNRVILGAADTFRAAAIEQIQVWGSRLQIDVVSHQPGADPSAVAFDTCQAAISNNANVVIIDTAGRLHTKVNLMDELSKIHRVISQHKLECSMSVLLSLDATTGQNSLSQARAFTETLNCNGVFLSKLDGTAKGGIAITIADNLNIPVLFIGTGEQLEDITVFNPEEFVDALFDITLPHEN